MKLKTTQKAVNSLFSRVYRIGYCDLQHVFAAADLQPFAYTARAEGWACDVYDVSDYDPTHSAAIATGYSAFGVRVNYDLIETADKLARALCAGIYCVVYSDDDKYSPTGYYEVRQKAGRIVLRALLTSLRFGTSFEFPNMEEVYTAHRNGLLNLREYQAYKAIHAALDDLNQ